MGRSKKITLVCDLGTSKNKVLYSVGRGGKVKHLVMGAEYFRLDSSTSRNFVVTSGLGRPEDNCWLDFGGDIHLVGRLAEENKASVSIKSLKYESVVPKILAILGSISYKEKLKTGFSVKLAILLPYGEMCDEELIQAELDTHIKEFKFQGNEFSVTLTSCVFIPEGFGILSHFLREKPPEDVQSSTLAVLMFGYRNTSLLVFQDGSLNRDLSNSTDFGFYNFSDTIIKRSSGLTRSAIQDAIVTRKERKIGKSGMGEDIFCTFIDVEELVNVRDPSRAAAQKQSLQSVIDEAKSDYWSMVQGWLDERLPSSRKVDSLIYTGGTCDLILEELRSYLGVKYQTVDVSGTASIESELLSQLRLEGKSLAKFKDQHLPLRFSDAWSYFRTLANYKLQELVEAA